MHFINIVNNQPVVSTLWQLFVYFTLILYNLQRKRWLPSYPVSSTSLLCHSYTAKSFISRTLLQLGGKLWIGFCQSHAPQQTGSWALCVPPSCALVLSGGGHTTEACGFPMGLSLIQSLAHRYWVAAQWRCLMIPALELCSLIQHSQEKPALENGGKADRWLSPCNSWEWDDSYNDGSAYSTEFSVVRINGSGNSVIGIAVFSLFN
jgi:hypothetical protein